MEHDLPEYADPKLRPRYLGLATFMRADLAGDLGSVDIGMIGIPYDGGVTNRPGARHGPREVRNQSSLMRTVNQATGVCPYDLATIADLGDVFAERPFELTSAHEQIGRKFAEIVSAGIVPLTCGGDHSITLPILRAVGADRPVGLVHIDAHADTGGDYSGSRFHHGAPFRVAVEEGLLDPRRTCQIGIRGSLYTPDMWEFSYTSGMRVIRMEEFEDMGWRAAIAEAKRVAGGGPVYVSFDIDALDPAFAPGTGTPEAGGLTMREAQRMIRELHDLDLVGADMVEVSPPFDPSGVTALNGATVMFELLCVLAQAVARRRG